MAENESQVIEFSSIIAPGGDIEFIDEHTDENGITLALRINLVGGAKASVYAKLDRAKALMVFQILSRWISETGGGS